METAKEKLEKLSAVESKKTKDFFYMFYDSRDNKVKMSDLATEAATRKNAVKLLERYRVRRCGIAPIAVYPHTQPIVDFLNEKIDWLKLEEHGFTVIDKYQQHREEEE